MVRKLLTAPIFVVGVFVCLIGAIATYIGAVMCSVWTTKEK